MRPRIAALVLAPIMGWTASARADIAPPDDRAGSTYCRPNQDEGEACTTKDGDDGTCGEEVVPCPDPLTPGPDECRLCEAGCSVAAVGASSGAPGGVAAAGVVLLLALSRRRRRSRGRA
ncbi:MAG: hypothetical protein HY744_14055 [Deltaproteobacteria bacterium]|nr:hypothetical protein [Deltaproteobacteria bacterium]